MSEYLTVDEFLDEKFERLKDELLEDWIISKALNILETRIALQQGDAAKAALLRSEAPMLPL